MQTTILRATLIVWYRAVVNLKNIRISSRWVVDLPAALDLLVVLFIALINCIEEGLSPLTEETSCEDAGEDNNESPIGKIISDRDTHPAA